MAKTDFIGKSSPRKEGRKKVTGQALYVDDLSFPDMLHGATVRSPAARGRIANISFEGDIPWDEFTIVTAKDIPGANHVALILTDQPFLAADFVNHPEEPVLLLAHRDKHLLEEARRNVTIEIEEQPAIFSLQESLAKKEIIWGEDNVFKKFLVDKGNVEEAWSTADFIVEGEYETGAQEQLYIENNGAIAIANASEGVTVWGSMQCPYYVHKALVKLFGLPEEKIRIIQTETGGGFGGKEEYPSLIAGHAALLAWKSGKPVKIIYDRAEDMVATTKRHPSRTHHKTAVTKDGKLLAMEIDFVIDGGAYCTLSPVVLSRGTIHAAGPYSCPNVRIHSRAVATNVPPHGAFRGFGAPQSIFALERHMDKVAHAVGLSPEEFRRRNFIHEGQTTATSQVIRERVDMDQLLTRALQLSEYQSKREQFARDNTARNGHFSKKARHRFRYVYARRGLYRFRRSFFAVSRLRGSDRRRQSSSTRRQHRDRPGHQHDLFANRRGDSRTRFRDDRDRSTRYRFGAEQWPNRGVAHVDGCRQTRGVGCDGFEADVAWQWFVTTGIQ